MAKERSLALAQVVELSHRQKFDCSLSKDCQHRVTVGREIRLYRRLRQLRRWRGRSAVPNVTFYLLLPESG